MKETLELDIIAIIIASILGIILHALHILPEEFITSLILLLLALHALHSTTQTSRDQAVHEKLLAAADKIGETQEHLIESKDIFQEGENLARKNQGEMWWYNTPLGFRNQKIFDKILKPAIENSKTTKITFILDKKFKETWETEITPVIEKQKNKEKINQPLWRDIDSNLAFRMIDVSQDKEIKEAHLTILEKPFIMKVQKTNTKAYHPRYMLHIKPKSKLIQDLKDLYLEAKMKD